MRNKYWFRGRWPIYKIASVEGTLFLLLWLVLSSWPLSWVRAEFGVLGIAAWLIVSLTVVIITIRSKTEPTEP